jgi:hypothetical protein
VTSAQDKQIPRAKRGPVARTLTKAARIMRIAQVLQGCLVWLLCSTGIWLLLFWLDNLLHLPAGLRLACLMACLPFMGLQFRRTVWQRLRAVPVSAVALHLEERFDVKENLLINALDFEGRELPSTTRVFAQNTVNAGQRSIHRQELQQLWCARTLLKWLAVVMLVMAVWGGYSVLRGRYMVNALQRFALPLADVPPAGSFDLNIEPQGDILVSEYDDLRILVTLKAKRTNDLAELPKIVWKENVSAIGPYRHLQDAATLQQVPDRDLQYEYRFTQIRRPFAFRVFVGNTYSASQAVTVKAVPMLRNALYHVTPPAYTAGAPSTRPGPPEPVTVLAGSTVRLETGLSVAQGRLTWQDTQHTLDFAKEDDLYRASLQIDRVCRFALLYQGPEHTQSVPVSEGMIALQADDPPRIELQSGQTRLSAAPGERVRIDLEAQDDFGLARIELHCAQSWDQGKTRRLKQWQYARVPGKQGLCQESLLLSVDASLFEAGQTYLLQARAHDHCPPGQAGESNVLMLDIRSLDDLEVAEDDPTASAFDFLEKAIAAQQNALGVTRNVKANLADLFADQDNGPAQKKALKRQIDTLSARQKSVGRAMRQVKGVSPKPWPFFVERMQQLEQTRHAEVVKRIEVMGHPGADQTHVAGELARVEPLQVYILDELIALRAVAVQSQGQAQKQPPNPVLNPEEAMPSVDHPVETMIQELKSFMHQQQSILDRRDLMMDKAPEDFSEPGASSLDELALEQSKLSQVLKRAVNDFTNLDLQDFGDNALVESMTSIFEKTEDLAAKAEAAAEQRMVREDAYRLETEVVEMAEEILINCEATLGFYDSIQFIAEIPEDEQLVAPLSELPMELEDLVGDLVTSEQEMQPEVEDIGSYLNSLDHTAGPVADGTISSMSAKGKTGDQKPEDNVIQGRSGAGRSGMSDGQVVEPVAKALEQNDYGLRERTSNTPLESGIVQDEDRKAQTGGTGLGKTTDGSTEFGSGGALPPQVLDMMRSVSRKQQRIRQATQQAATRLGKHKLPTDTLADSIGHMDQLEQALDAQDGVGIRRAYSQTLDSLKQSHHAVARYLTIQNHSDRDLAYALKNMQSQAKQARFKGYEHLIGAYFEALARSRDAVEKQSQGGTQ